MKRNKYTFIGLFLLILFSTSIITACDDSAHEDRKEREEEARQEAWQNSPEGKAATAKWEDIENKLWVIPAHIMKNKKEHKVPLTEQMINLLDL